MSIRQMEFMVKVAEERSFTKAASKLKVSQPSLSQSILNLEQELGVLLFDRTKNPVSLTDTGELYLEKAKTILAMMDSLKSQVKNSAHLKSEKIKIGFSQNAHGLIPDVLPNFCSRFYDSNIKIAQLFASIQVKQMVVDGEVDIGLIILPYDLSGISYEAIKEEKLCLALSITHPLARKMQKYGKYPEISLQDVKDEKFIMPREANIAFRQLLEDIFKKENVKLNLFCETETFEISNSIIAAGSGAYFTMPSSINHKYQDKIALFKVKEVDIRMTLSIIYKKGAKLPELASQFIQMAKNH